MPESPSPFDDPFADLFGKLPDPRTGAAATSAASARSAPTAPSGSARPSSTDRGRDAASPPASRRAARAAAAGPLRADGAAATGDTGPVRPPHDPSAARTAPAPAEPRPAQTPASRAAQQPAVPAATASAAAASAVGSSGSAAPAPVRDAHAPAASATLEDLFTGARSTDELGAPPPPPDRRRRRLGGWIALAVVVAILGGLTAGGFYVWNTYEDKIRAFMGSEEPQEFDAGAATGEAIVTIASGDTGQPISQTLFDAGVTKTPSAFYDYLIDTGQNPPFVPGVFRLQQQMTSEAALAALLDPANKMENGAQLREGLTVEDSLPILAEGTGVPLADLQAAVADPAAYGVSATSLEGWLFPATYEFNPGVTAPEIIQRLVERTVQSLDTAGVPAEDRERILTIASIIQREARFEADFYKVSRVIENRLDPSNQETFGLLQMDSTAQYGYGENRDGTVSSSSEALTDDNPWNTYVKPGLPVGPIANPGDLAIDAAMHPVEGPWLYFVTVNLDTGETVFTTNNADHNAAVRQWQAWCAENPDSGC